MSHLHSSAQPRFTYLAKTVKGMTRRDEKAAKDNADKAAEAACYRKVDRRDGLRCRVTGIQLTLGGSLVKAAQRHHMKKRSQGGAHLTANVITVSKAVHDQIEVLGILKLEGDADQRDERGAFNGVAVIRWTDGGAWVTEKWV